MRSALIKANKVAEALKKFDTESEFWKWYDREIKEESQLENNLIMFSEAIGVVEEDFWDRPSRTGRVRDKSNPSDLASWRDTYGRFYKHLPPSKLVNLTDVMRVIERWQRGTKTYKGVVSAMKRLTRMTKHRNITNQLENLNVTQTKFKPLSNVTQTKFKPLSAISLEEFMQWREQVLTNSHGNANRLARKAWLWVFSMQVVYGLRIHEVFAIQNLNSPFVTVDRVTIESLTSSSNFLLVIGELTALGTTTKTNYRLARPFVPPSHPDLINVLEINNPLLPTNRPTSEDPNRIVSFYGNTARYRLIRWKCPVTQTHAFRHLANHNGIQAGIPLEIRALSMGHTPEMNESTYKRRRRTKTTIDLLLNYCKE
ncbi:hypothetical protein [Myxosarcina sp. GI1(2024)]